MALRSIDLMVGDWVVEHDHGYNSDGSTWESDETTKITAINEYGVDTKRNYHLRYDEIEPIPLTPEILEKNGFKNTNVVTIGTRQMRWVSDDTRTEVTIWMDDTLPMEIVKNVYYEDEVAYTLPFPGTVSQLQHALRLCGINLEITV